ncbi:putative repressor LexA [Aedoeadaptatus nemausensis]|uniref:Putative repressor LexA n=1 Tax=Aedoeadaptatus nemausensis TaxID=2582829 RepID=A0A6V6Y4E9_9FIRM|nr:S24 family peptidase [Peptoniphilus nemausensis]CAC9931759.1 putative repressor LexA [Peptoniphilus nemausensis]
MNIGELIRDKRKYLELSQQELADKIGVSKSAISRYESGTIGNMGLDKAQALVNALNLDPLVLLGFVGFDGSELKPVDLSTAVKIPVVGSIPAGTPVEAIEDVVDYIDIPEDWVKGDAGFIGLDVKGDSMYPVMLDGDRVVIRLQPSAETGDICACYVNGYDATLKRVSISPTSITLKPENPGYPPKTYTHPGEVTIVGKVVEIRRKV